MYSGNKALIISGNDETREYLASALGSFGGVSVSDGGGVREVISSGGFDLVILSTPLADEFGLELASFICGSTNAALIIIVSQKNFEAVNKKIAGMNAYVLQKPVNKQQIHQAIRFVMTARSKILSLDEEKNRLEKTIRDLKQIDRAKCALIQYLRISEEDAHRMIQKRAMDERVPEAQIALDILKTYEI